MKTKSMQSLLNGFKSLMSKVKCGTALQFYDLSENSFTLFEKSKTLLVNNNYKMN